MRVFLLIALIILIPSSAQACKFHEDREEHQKKIEQHQSNWHDDYTSKENARINEGQQRDDDRTAHQSRIAQSQEKWREDWESTAPKRNNKETQRNDDRAAHQSKIESQPERWWKDYPVNE